MSDIEEFRRMKVDVLKKYCLERGLSVSKYKRKDELVALAFTACAQNMPVVTTKAEQVTEARQEYGDLLVLDDDTVLPDQESLDASCWLSEADDLKLWPPCMVMNISDYLISKNERPLCTRLSNDYKEGKCIRQSLVCDFCHLSVHCIIGVDSHTTITLAHSTNSYNLPEISPALTPIPGSPLQRPEMLQNRARVEFAQWRDGRHHKIGYHKII